MATPIQEKVHSPAVSGTDDKSLDGSYTPPALGSNLFESGIDAFTWTEAEERRVRWKLHSTVLVLLFFGFYVFQLERGNISNALTDGFMAKIGITQVSPG